MLLSVWIPYRRTRCFRGLNKSWIDEVSSMNINDIETCLSNYYTDGIIMSEDCIKELFNCLEELKIFQELYPDADGKSSLVINYNNGWNDAIEKVSDIASWNQKGLGGYYSITSEELDLIKK